MIVYIVVVAKSTWRTQEYQGNILPASLYFELIGPFATGSVRSGSIQR